MIRNIYAYVVLSLAASCVLACSPDLGNYEYSDLKEPSVNGIEDASVLMFSRLSMTPQLEGGDFPAGEYSYEWKVLDNNGGSEAVVIGTEKDLDYEVVLLPGSYTLFFTVTETATGLFWQYEATLTVSSSTSEGWMVLCSDGGRARLDVMSAVYTNKSRQIHQKRLRRT